MRTVIEMTAIQRELELFFSHFLANSWQYDISFIVTFLFSILYYSVLNTGSSSDNNNS